MFDKERQWKPNPPNKTYSKRQTAKYWRRKHSKGPKAGGVNARKNRIHQAREGRVITLEVFLESMSVYDYVRHTIPVEDGGKKINRWTLRTRRKFWDEAVQDRVVTMCRHWDAAMYVNMGIGKLNVEIRWFEHFNMEVWGDVTAKD